MAGKKGMKHVDKNLKEKAKILKLLATHPLPEVVKLCGRTKHTVEKVARENALKIEAIKNKLADDLILKSQTVFEKGITDKKIQDAKLRDVVDAGKNIAYTHFLLKEGISPDASKQTVIIGMQFSFSSPNAKKSPVLGGFKDEKITEGEVKDETRK